MDVDRNGDGVVDSRDCTAPAPGACASGVATDTDRNGDGVVTAADCVVPRAGTPTGASPAVAAAAVDRGSSVRPAGAAAVPEVLGAATEAPGAHVATPAAPAGATAAATPASPQVMGVTVEQAPAAATTPASPQVMGVTLEQAPAAAAEPAPAVLADQQGSESALPRTGGPPLLGESLVGLLLVAAGGAMVRRSRREPC